jgi:hypothetical protein
MKMKIIKKIFLLFVFVLLTGCVALGHKVFYEQTAPSKYPTTTKVLVFEYQNVNIREIYELLFDDFIVVGKSGFIGPYQPPQQATEFAKSIGADVYISTAQFKETNTSFVTTSVPTTSTTYVSGFTGRGSFYGTATSYGTSTTIIPVSQDRYKQFGLYLRNINNVLPLWERKLSDYKETDVNELSGIWRNENYELKIIKSGNQMVAFITDVQISTDRDSWKINDLKMIFSFDSRVGVYLMSDKTPQPAKFKLNKFGHLEIGLIGHDDYFSFSRKQSK